jgi:hypothetical protein
LGTLVVVSIHDFRRQAQDRGIAVSYQDWHGRACEVSDETLAAILKRAGAC